MKVTMVSRWQGERRSGAAGNKIVLCTLVVEGFGHERTLGVEPEVGEVLEELKV